MVLTAPRRAALQRGRGQTLLSAVLGVGGVAAGFWLLYSGLSRYFHIEACLSSNTICALGNLTSNALIVDGLRSAEISAAIGVALWLGGMVITAKTVVRISGGSGKARRLSSRRRLICEALFIAEVHGLLPSL